MLGIAASGQICELMLDNVPAGIAIFDRDMRYLGCSRRFREEFGLGDRDVVGQLHYDVFPGMPEDVRATHRRILAGATETAELDILQWPDGTIDWVEWKMMPWRDQDGEIGGALLFANRKTEQVALQTREQTSHLAMQLLIDSAADYAIIMAGLDQKISMWSSGAERLFGWTASEAIGQTLSIIQVPDEQQDSGIGERLSQVVEMGGFRDRGWRKRKDGSQVMVDLTASPIRDQFGRLIAYCGVLRDITPDLERERVLRENAARLRSIVDTVPDAMITMDEYGIVESFSAAAERLFGYRAAEVVGQNIAMLMPEPDRSRHDGYLARYRADGVRHIIGKARRVFGQRKDGSVFAHELHVGEFEVDGRRVFTGFIRDLTQREADAAQLRETEAELAQISRGAALATMGSALAHELNQPLTAIANYLQAAASIDPAGGEGAVALLREALEESSRQALRAGEIIHRLRAFLARSDLERRIADTAEVVKDALALALPGADAGSVNLDMEISPDCPAIFADRIQIQQVLINLVRNAFEALGGTGRIEVYAEPHPDGVHFTVLDDGPGLPLELEHHLFEPFSGARTKGMGLGLAISRTIIEANGGRMWHKRVPTGGAAFHFTVPVAEDSDG